MEDNEKMQWKKIKQILLTKTPKQLTLLIKKLHDADPKNRQIILHKLELNTDYLKMYTKRIDKAIPTEFFANSVLCLSDAKRVISDFKKQVGDIDGLLELMVYFVTRGNSFTLAYGDVDEDFYSSLESMFNKILQTLEKYDQQTKDRYFQILEECVKQVEGGGWGYYDSISTALKGAFPEKYAN